MIKSIRLRNWGQYGDDKFDFDPKTNLIVGANFSGKTSLVNAIYYSFTGKLLSMKASPNGYVRLGAKQAEVQLDLRTNEQDYRIVRSTGARVAQLLRIDASGRPYQVARSATLVQTLFGVGVEEILLATFLREGDAYEFLTHPPSDRRKLLESLLNMEQLSLAIERLKEARRIANAQSREVGAQMKSVSSRASRLSEVPDNVIHQKEGELTKLKAEAEQIKSQVAGSGITPEKLKALGDKLASDRARLASLETDLTKSLGDFFALEDIDARLAELSSAQTKPDGLENELSGMQVERGELQGKLAILKEEIAFFEGNHEHCPTCKQAITPELRQQVLSVRTAEWQDVETKITELQSRFEVVQGRKKKEEAESLEQESLKTRAEVAKRLMEQIKELHTSVETDANYYQQVSADVNAESLQRLDELTNEIASREKELINLKGQEELKRNYMQEYQDIYHRVGSLSRLAKLLNLGVKAAEGAIVRIVDQTLALVEERAQRVLSRFDLFSDGVFGMREGVLMPKIQKAIGSVDFSMLSGSEKLLSFLALKLGLASTVVQTDFLVYDDPTAHLDSERIQSLGAFLTRLDGWKQLIVTTSSEEFAQHLPKANIIRLQRTP